MASDDGAGRGTDDESDADDSVPCPVYDDSYGRPCGEPIEPGTLTCVKHRVRSTSTQVSRMDNARRRYGV